MVGVTVAVCVNPPPAPVTVTVEAPRAAVPLAVRVSVALPAPAMPDGLKVAATPEGSPLAESAMVPLKPPETVLVIVDVPDLPTGMLKEDGLADSVKPG